MWLARPLQLGSFFISIAYRGVFVWLLLLCVIREAFPRHLKALNVEKHVESKSNMFFVNWSESAITNFSSWDPADAVINSATTLSSPQINTFAIRKRRKNVLRKKRSEDSSNPFVTINYRSSEQPRVNTVHHSPTSTESSTLVTSSVAHIRLRTSTATALTTKETNYADPSVTKEEPVTTPTYAIVSNTSEFSEISTSVTENTVENKLLEKITVPNIRFDDNETSVSEITWHDSFAGDFDDASNTSNTTEQLESNSVFDATRKSVVGPTTEFINNIWHPPLSSNSADSIAFNPTVEGVNGGRDLLGIGAIVGIILGVLLLVILVAGIFGFLIYRKRLRPLSEVKFPTDNCGYVDDTLRENSEEMFSLDNDSFLNSLEAMTLQNYWAEDAKNTKV